tara:strand:+ start:3089 stop:6076 length:2988 start_codon:yes stop_codon:yes gene_type:complete
MGFLMREKILTEKLTSSFINNDLINDLCKIINKDDIKFDQESKMMYSTDASIYHMEPICIIFPKNEEIVKHIIKIANKYNVSIVPRGAGTSLAGQAINTGIMLDFSRYMRKIIEINPVEKWAIIQPGIVVEEFNKELKKHGLQYAIDTSTKNRATVGGGIGNNSCGTHSIIYGKTSDHVKELKVVLSDGELIHTYEMNEKALLEKADLNNLESSIYKKLPEIVNQYKNEIVSNFPSIDRRVSGYNLDSVIYQQHKGNTNNIASVIVNDSHNIDLTKIIIGSEGTLGIVVEAKVNLVELPKFKGLVVSTYDSIIEAAKSTNDILDFHPSAIELVDKKIISGCMDNPGLKHYVDFLTHKPDAILINEFFGDSENELTEKLENVAEKLSNKNNVQQVIKIIDHEKQENIWKMRQAGLGLLMNVQGDAKPYAFVEDTAVDPKYLPEFLDKFQKIIADHGTVAGFYGHASVGCLHIRPMINLKNNDELEKMHSIAQQIASLVLQYGGSLSGEHGDGILRGVFTEKMFGKELTEAFREIKLLFDPKKIMNPGKIIDTPGFTDNLKIAPDRQMKQPKTILNFDDEGGFHSLVEQCNGQGACRKFDGVMCPSYMVTLDEEHSTRGRANLIRELLTNQEGQNGLLNTRLMDALDLCVGCKACKTECPSQVDMAKLKVEILHQYQEENGVSLRTNFLANINKLLKIGSKLPIFINFLNSNIVSKYLLHIFVGIHKDTNLPKIANQSFKKWFNKNHHSDNKNKKVVLFADTFTNYIEPNIGKSAYITMKELGYEVIVLNQELCCGRPAISKGKIQLAKKMAKDVIQMISQYTSQDIPVIFLEPSCFSAVFDDYKGLIKEEYKINDKNLLLFEEFLIQHEKNMPGSLQSILDIDDKSIAIHPHCHQKALGKGSITLELTEKLGIDAKQLESTCCGMAGSFGIEKEHYQISKDIAKLGIIKKINALEKNEIIIASGTSCRQQVLQHNNSSSMHIAEFLSDSLTVHRKK